MQWKKEKIKEIIDYINSLFKERDELAKILVLAILSKQHVFLVGEAGVGKTGIVKEIIDLFKDAKFFKTLVTHDTQEEDLFGNIKDRDKRLQSIINSNFVFLDEVYKGSPKLLNSCLELMNERIYSNGFETIDIPLYSLFAASNEYPQR
jgi:MoxR-like ATPase